MKMIRVGGLWKHKDSKGKTYLQGKLGAMYIQIRSNDFKEGENEPDYNLYFTQSEKKAEHDEVLDASEDDL